MLLFYFWYQFENNHLEEKANLHHKLLFVQTKASK